MLFEARHDTQPDLTYARGVPDAFSPDPTSFDKKQCTLVIVEIGFCKDLGCDVKIDKKTEKYSPLIAALRRYWVGWSSLPFPWSTRVTHSPRPYTTSPPPSPPSDRPWRDHEPVEAPPSPPRTTMLGPTTTTCSSRCWNRLRTWPSPAS
jgi:hypothetical protein